MLTHLSLDRHFLCILPLARRSSRGAMGNEAHCKPMDPGHPIQHNPGCSVHPEPLDTALPPSTLCLVPQQGTCSRHCCCPNPEATPAGLRSGGNTPREQTARLRDCDQATAQKREGSQRVQTLPLLGQSWREIVTRSRPRTPSSQAGKGRGDINIMMAGITEAGECQLCPDFSMGWKGHLDPEG